MGTVADFTFSLAHYYTWSDTLNVRAGIISPTPQHLLWDFNGLGNPALVPSTNPWGSNDPTVGLRGISVNLRPCHGRLSALVAQACAS